MSPFEPKDEVPVWRTLYELLQAAPVDSVVPYDAMMAITGRDKSAVQSAVRRAAKELLVSDQRAIEAVPNQGYRIVTPDEHLTLARRHQRKSSRSLARGHGVTTHVDMSDMSVEVRRSFEAVARAFSMQMEFNRRLDVRQTELEDQIATMHPKVERNETELAALRARLENLENNSK